MSDFSYITRMMYVSEFEELYRRVLNQASIYQNFVRDMGFECVGVGVDFQSIDGDCYSEDITGYVEKWRIEFNISSTSGISVNLREYAKINVMRLIDLETGDEVFRSYEVDELDRKYVEEYERMGLTSEQAYDRFAVSYDEEDPYVEIKERVDREIDIG